MTFSIPLLQARVISAHVTLGASPITTNQYQDFLAQAGEARWVLLRPSDLDSSGYQSHFGRSAKEVFEKAGIDTLRCFHMNHQSGPLYSVGNNFSFYLRSKEQISEPFLPGQPVYGLTWFEAMAFCVGLGGRLPTTAEYQQMGLKHFSGTCEWLFDSVYGGNCRKTSETLYGYLKEDFPFSYANNRTFRIAFPTQRDKPKAEPTRPPPPQFAAAPRGETSDVRLGLGQLLQSVCLNHQLTPTALWRIARKKGYDFNQVTFSSWWSGKSGKPQEKNQLALIRFLLEMGAEEKTLVYYFGLHTVTRAKRLTVQT